MIIVLLIWVGTMVFAILLGTFLCYRIEKSGVERWGATGHLFKYELKKEERGKS